MPMSHWADSRPSVAQHGNLGEIRDEEAHRVSAQYRRHSD